MSNINDFEIKEGVLLEYRGNDTDVVIPNSVTKIGKEAFEDCESCIIIAPAGSYAIQYAKKHDISYQET